MTYQTEQEEFWAGEFGEAYMVRNDSRSLVSSNLNLFSTILSKTEKVDRILELGANIGLNLKAIKLLKPDAKISAVEINPKAAERLKLMELDKVYVGSIIEFKANEVYDLVLTKGVLIHINPNILPQVYDCMYESSSRYICLVEYYNPSPIAINYRDHEDRLFKRDFCGDLLSRFPNLKLVDYGFVYFRDNNFPGDDLTWFLLEKR